MSRINTIDQIGSAMCRIPEMASRCMRKTDNSPEQLNELVYEIRDAIKAVDPTVTSVGVYYDWDADGNRRLCGIMLERKDAPMFARPGEGDVL